MPYCHKSEDGQIVGDGSDMTPESGRGAATKRNVYVSHNPAVEATVPPSPESGDGIVVAHAANHVLGRIDTVKERPQSEKPPWKKKFQPDMLQVEIPQHAQLHGGI